jgi:hypothetical protein
MKTKAITVLATLLLGFSLTSAGASEKQRSLPVNKAWQEECGSCHLAFPPNLLPSASWQAMMAGLDKHFGSDASLDAAKQKEIAAFLAANASRRSEAASGPDGRPLLRITETAWFRKEHRDGHDGLTPAVWKSPAVKSAANCAACHTQAAQGDYRERNIRIPNGAK